VTGEAGDEARETDPVKASVRARFLGIASLAVAGTFLPARAAAVEPETRVYRQVGARRLEAYVFRPSVPGSSRPAILMFHGGGWKIGEPSWVFDRARELAARGLVAVAIEYRLSKDGLSPADAVEDACGAFAWARAEAVPLGIDPRRVAGYGVSAGGHLVAAAATLPSVKGRPIGDHERPTALVLFSPALGMAHDQYFGELMAGHADPASYSPLEFVGPRLPPTLVIQGEEDSVVLARDARAFCAVALRAGAACSLHVYPKVGHLLTRNLKVQYKDFDSDPDDAADARRKEDAFLAGLGYLRP
jgi:acetyl esterase/lipase